MNKYIELEEILTFLGIEFIDFKGKRTSNGHKTAKTIGEIKDFFGHEIITSGQHIENIKWFDFKNNWNDLMFLVEKIESLNYTTDIQNIIGLGHYFRIYSAGADVIEIRDYETKIKSVYKGCLKFIKWYNQQKTTK